LDEKSFSGKNINRDKEKREFSTLIKSSRREEGDQRRLGEKGFPNGPPPGGRTRKAHRPKSANKGGKKKEGVWMYISTDKILTSKGAIFRKRGEGKEKIRAFMRGQGKGMEVVAHYPLFGEGEKGAQH